MRKISWASIRKRMPGRSTLDETIAWTRGYIAALNDALTDMEDHPPPQQSWESTHSTRVAVARNEARRTLDALLEMKRS